jgi:UPF0755 protein
MASYSSSSVVRLRRQRIIAWLSPAIVFVVGALLYANFMAPADFFMTTDTQADTSDIRVTIPSGSTVGRAAQLLRQAGVVRSASVLHLSLVFLGDKIKAGTYTWQYGNPENVFAVAARLVQGDTRPLRVRVTFPEGFSAADMTLRLAKSMPDAFDINAYAHAAEPKEGFLFPDTYFIDSDMTAERVVAWQYERFWETLHTCGCTLSVARGADDTIVLSKPDLKNSLSAKVPAAVTKRVSLRDIVIMASILEAEGRTQEDRVQIASILWKRIDMGIPLQVDATLTYALGRSTYTLTSKDLRSTHPFNTYVYKGLPPRAINNPGIDALRAAASYDPTTPYLFYLSDKQGRIHFARTLAEHTANKRKYVDILKK